MFKKIILVLILISSTLMSADIKWENDFKSAVNTAKKANKPVLFVFSRHTCHYCQVLDETTFKDAKVIEALNKDFISVISYSDDGDYTPEELWRPGTPALWFLMPSGEPMFQVLMGAIGPDKFLKVLSKVKKEFDENFKK